MADTKLRKMSLTFNGKLTTTNVLKCFEFNKELTQSVPDIINHYFFNTGRTNSVYTKIQILKIWLKSMSNG